MRPPNNRVFGIQIALIAFAFVLLLLASGCGGEEITHSRVNKSSSQAMTSVAARRPMAREEVPPPPSPSGANALKWTLPEGWTDATGSGMRYATLKPPIPGKVDVSVVVLPGPAGGELANVNRWRGQIGLPPIDEEKLSAARKPMKTRAGDVAVYDFTSEGQAKTRMIAGLLVTGGNSWFVKMVGDADAVAAARGGFLQILETLRLD
jgi:hypothetical protein